jgi:hypothetical protein
MPVRDVFDSSLDAVVMVQPLTFREAKRLIRARMSSGPSERMSDSQVLLCHCLAGGLPRDLLRFCRQLGEVNSKLGCSGTLDKVLVDLLNSEVRVRLDGVLAALQSREERSSASAFIGDLEIIDDAYRNDRTLEALGKFLSDDRGFYAFCRPINDDGRLNNSNNGKDADWIHETRRQLYSYLYFIQTVREAFGPDWRLVEGNESNVDKILPVFDLLASARRQIEADAAAGWRRTTQVRVKLGLALLDVSPSVKERGKPSSEQAS